MAKHSREPWRVEVAGSDPGRPENRGRIVAEIRVQPSGPVYWIIASEPGDPEADARRIVTCVNLCRSMPLGGEVHDDNDEMKKMKAVVKKAFQEVVCDLSREEKERNHDR
jgi:hypothetical protein